MFLIQAHLPIAVVMTIWTQNRRKSRKIVNLPTGLHFHAEEDISEENSENIEIYNNYDIIDILDHEGDEIENRNQSGSDKFWIELKETLTNIENSLD